MVLDFLSGILFSLFWNFRVLGIEFIIEYMFFILIRGNICLFIYYFNVAIDYGC